MLEGAGRRVMSTKYLRVGQSAKNRLFGVPPIRRGPSLSGEEVTPLQMLISRQGKISSGRLAILIIGLFTLAVGIILSSIPWVDYLIIKNLKLWNGTLSYYYWQKPGVVRLTKVFVFNVTNPEGILQNSEKPKLQEIGPFVYKEDMEKVNVVFHENGTVTFQHRKILEFLPEMSVSKDTRLVVPNIPLLTLTSKAAELPRFMRLGLDIGLRALYRLKVFNSITADELLFGYEEPLTNLAHKFYPKNNRPPSKMGLLIGRNATTLSDVATIFTGHNGFQDFGLMDRLNGLDHLPQWKDEPCNSVSASEGSFFPPREVTGADLVHVWDKDLCRRWPLRYRGETRKAGIEAGLYTPDESMIHLDEPCFCPRGSCPPPGLHYIAPCHFGAPVYSSFPHFFDLDNPEITEAVEGLTPQQEKHQTIFKIQGKLGVPLEARVRLQLNLYVSKANFSLVRNFPQIMFPVIWVEEGAEELPPHILRWLYLSTSVAPWLGPLFCYLLAATGAATLALSCLRSSSATAAANAATATASAASAAAKRRLRRGSSFLINGQHRLLILRDSYTLLQSQPSPVAETSFEP